MLKVNASSYLKDYLNSLSTRKQLPMILYFDNIPKNQECKNENLSLQKFHLFLLIHLYSMGIFENKKY